MLYTRSAGILLVLGVAVFAARTPELSRQEKVMVTQAVQSEADFAADLYRQLSQTADGGNLFFSPHSVATILALTTDGARGRTAREMVSVLKLQARIDGQGVPDLSNVQSAIAALHSQLDSRDDTTELTVANALWADAGMPLRKPFVQGVLAADPAAAIENVDFRKDSEMARTRINNWTDRKTSGRIKELLAAGSLNDLTRLVLTNAVYFRGDWATQFQSNRTRPTDFTVAGGGEPVRVPLMFGLVQAGYADQDGFSVLDLPYAGGKLSLLVILPDQVDGLSKIETQLSSDWLAKRIASLKTQQVRVGLPRFRLETQYSLKQTLSDLGMPTAFGRSADLTGLTDASEGQQLSISQVQHKAFLEVNEQGSEAAAATAVVVTARSARPRSAAFIANRPFLFAIRDRASGLLLFLGRLSQPQPAK